MGSSNQILLLFLPLSLLLAYSHASLCKPASCGTIPLIRFPFRIKGSLQDSRCGYPGFDLSCKDNTPFIHIPILGGDVLVKRIDYKNQILYIEEQSNCIWSFLFNNLNFSCPPLESSYISNRYSLVHCSKKVVDLTYGYLIPCLSGAEHNAFALSSENTISWLRPSCKRIKSISVPVIYPLDVNVTPATPPPSAEEVTFMLEELYYYYYNRRYFYYNFDEALFGLVWYVPRCVGCEFNGTNECGYKNNRTNQTLCSPIPIHTPIHNKGSQRKEHVIIIVSSIGLFLLLTTLVITVKVFCSWRSNRKLDLENEKRVEKFLENYKYLKPTRYSYADLKRMTGQFKENLGQGGYGSVFKGMLSNGTLVAVKILKSFDIDGEDFINEVGTMGKIHHVNVVRLLGFCADRLKRALVYEFMPNESLGKYIFSTNTQGNFLGWEKLYQIAIGIAKGIEYLHQGCEQRILHFDIKPHNILLDQKFNPKISDFGLAKLCSKGQSVVSMTNARGTMGYIAPEVFSRNFGNVSYKSDVYSYGMLLLEMVGGRKNIDVTVKNTSKVYFPEWIHNRITKEEDMGFKFETDEDANRAKKLIIVALWCIQWNPVDRPSMRNAVQMLEGSTESLMMPPDPFVSSASTSKDENNTCITNLSTIPE